MKNQIERCIVAGLLVVTMMSGVASAAAENSSDYCKPNAGIDMVDISEMITARFAKKMKEVGVSVVARYYDYSNETLPGKRLRPEEIKFLSDQGLKMLVVFQHNNNKAATFKDWKNRGPGDAAEALKLAGSFSQQANSAIYFGVDGDFVGQGSGFLSNEVKNYFDEVKSTFNKAKTNYAIGVYGSGAACDMLRSEKLVQYCWISQSRGFVGTADSLKAGRYDIEQYLPGRCGGKSMDFNRFKPGTTDIGQFAP